MCRRTRATGALCVAQEPRAHGKFHAAGQWMIVQGAVAVAGGCEGHPEQTVVPLERDPRNLEVSALRAQRDRQTMIQQLY